MPITLHLPPRPPEEQTRFNLRRWEELCSDAELAKLEQRLETDRHGQIIMTPPPAPKHGSYQIEIGALLRQFMKSGRVIAECPVSTSDGVKGVDVAWISAERLAPMEGAVCFVTAPEICVEILSPSNTSEEMDEKRELYFEAGAEEFWLCSESGAMSFFSPAGPLEKSEQGPEFPRQVNLP